MADGKGEETDDAAIDPVTPSRSIVSIRMVLLSVLVAAGILGAIFVLDPAFLDDSPPQAAVDDADQTEGGQGDGEGREGGRRGGGFDPAAFFAERDADGNGVIEGDEISDRMAERLEQIDTDGDGKVSQEEFMSGMRSRGGGGRGAGDRGAGGRGQGRGGESGDRASRRPGGSQDSNESTSEEDSGPGAGESSEDTISPAEDNAVDEQTGSDESQN